MQRSLIPAARLAAAALVCLSTAAFAEDEWVPDFAIEVDVRDDVTLDFSQIDVMVNKDPVPQIAGVTDQFGGGTTLGEVLLKEPIPMAELEAMAAANQSDAMSFRCDRGGLYEVEGTRLVSGQGCEIVPADAVLTQTGAQFPEATETVPELIERWDASDSGCRLARSDDVKVAAACLTRSVYGAALNERNWCIGREGESNAEMSWHECEVDSLRFPPFELPGQ